jgi:hypothetical protein|tara:strand:+ start:644 stop:1075 length:432 start_codon:yes stop_codon:yes gene_type:complete
MKRGKEITLKSKDNYKVKLGTIDNKSPKTIYLNVSAWGKPLTQEDNYDNIISNLRKKIKQKLYSQIGFNNFEKERYIVDLDMRSSGINHTKRSFMSCEITLFQKERVSVNDTSMMELSNNLTNNIIQDCFEENNHFRFYKTKK